MNLETQCREFLAANSAWEICNGKLHPDYVSRDFAAAFAFMQSVPKSSQR